MVREWDPQTAPSAEIESILNTLNAVLAVDLPDDPPWLTASFREYLAVTMPGERRVCWIAESAPGQPPGTRGEPRDPRPGQRAAPRRHGRARCAACTRRPAAPGSAAICSAPPSAAPSPRASRRWASRWSAAPRPSDFYESVRIHAARSSKPQRTRPVHRGLASGWARWRPVSAPATASSTTRAARPTSCTRRTPRPRRSWRDSLSRPATWNCARARTNARAARGQPPDAARARPPAVHRASASTKQTGEVAALTEVVVVPAQHPTRADQYDTVVVPKHRGYGLGRAMKARMLFELRSAEPQVTDGADLERDRERAAC